MVAFLPGLAIVSRHRLRSAGVIGDTGFLATAVLLVFADVLAEGRIGEDHVEPTGEDPVDIHQAVVIVNSAMAIAVHDHVHLGSAGGSRLGIGAEDTIICQFPHP